MSAPRPATVAPVAHVVAATSAVHEPGETVSPRLRLVRDAALAMMVVGGLLFIGSAIFAPREQGAVLGETATPASPSPSESPSASPQGGGAIALVPPLVQATAVPTSDPTAAPTPTVAPTPTAVPTRRPTPKPTAVPVATANPTPRPTPKPTPKPARPVIRSIDDAAVGCTVSFTVVVIGQVTSYDWAFGDGATSTLKAPTHTYPGSGTYPARLIVRNAGGQDLQGHTVNVSCP